MTGIESFRYEVSEEIRRIALGFPEATEGSSCVNRAFKAGAKNFLFVGESETGCMMRFKVKDSLDALVARSATDVRFEVGSSGWVKLMFEPGNAPAPDELFAWIAESFLLLAPKKIAVQFER